MVMVCRIFQAIYGMKNLLGVEYIYNSIRYPLCAIDFDENWNKYSQIRGKVKYKTS